MFKDAVVGLLASRLYILCCGMISIGNGLSYKCFGQVYKGLLVFSAAECITYPWSCLPRQSGLAKPIDHLGDFWPG